MNRKSWLILLVAYGCGVLATFAQFSVPPILPSLRVQFGMSYTQSGMLMSLFAIATLFFATPCGFIIHRYGVRRVGLLGFILMMLGLGVCFLAGSFGVFLAGRAIQGVGFGLVAVSAPTAIGQFLPREMMPMAMGLWSTWIPVGNLIIFFTAPRVLQATSVAVYWAILIASMVPGLVAFAWAIPNPPKATQAGPVLPSRQVLKDELANGDVWAASITFAAFTFGMFSLTTWSSTYLHEVMGLSLVLAASGTIIYGITSIFSDLYGGVLLKRFGHSRWMFILPPAFLILLWPLYTIPSVTVFCIVIGVYSLIGGVIPPIIFASAPMLARRPEGVGMATAIIIIGENMGLLVGPQVFGILRDWTGSYRASFWLMMLGPLVQVFSLHRIWATGVFAGARRPAPALLEAGEA
ncbi:MAG: MFS transporter [Holophaga sp.]|nr:MFS transporter [Holophaga sp.]